MDEDELWALSEMAEDAGRSMLYLMSQYAPDYREGRWPLDAHTLGEALLNSMGANKLRISDENGVRWHPVIDAAHKEQGEWLKQRKNEVIDGN